MIDLLAAVLRGDEVPAAAIARFDPHRFCAEAVSHGVLPLVADRLAERSDLPDALQTLLRQKAGEAAVADLLGEVELKRLVAELDSAGIGALIIKGSHLAYSLYPRPDLRPRLDTDLLIEPGARARTYGILTRLGYERAGKVSGDLITRQSFHVKRRQGAAVHSVDVHWNLNDPVVFADVLSYEELAARAVTIPALGSARAPCDVDALVIACVHRVSHHLDSMRLNWLYDIHLLARRLGEREWHDFVELAVNRKIAAVCRRSLDRAIVCFRTPVPDAVITRLRAAETTSSEITAGYLSARPQAQALADDLRTLRTWRERVTLLRENLLPPAHYMRTVYAPSSGMPLPVLYAWRILHGARKWLTG